jgi:hypothetical protein
MSDAEGEIIISGLLIDGEEKKQKRTRKRLWVHNTSVLAETVLTVRLSSALLGFANGADNSSTIVYLLGFPYDAILSHRFSCPPANPDGICRKPMRGM